MWKRMYRRGKTRCCWLINRYYSAACVADVGKKKDLNYGRGGTTKGGDNILGGDVDEYLDDGALDVDDEYDFM